MQAQELMRKQRDAMLTYSEALSDRIARFPADISDLKSK